MSLKRAEYSTMEIVEGEATDHVIDIPRVNEGLLAKIRDRFSNSRPPITLPPETRTNEKRCIFRLPSGRLNNLNGKSIEPQVVALGPYHHGKRQLQNMEELKWQWLTYFMKSRNEKLEECLIELGLLEKEVRECYSESETIKLSSDDLLQMMLVDGFFLLVLFFRSTLSKSENLARPKDLNLNVELAIHVALELGGVPMFLGDSPIFRLDIVILPKIYRDLLLLENQIPSCVLKTLYRICLNISPTKYSLSNMAMTFLCSILVIPKSKNNMLDSLEWLHLLDLVRSILISRHHSKEMRRSILISRRHSKERWRTKYYKQFSPIPCVTKLCHAGIKVNRHMVDTFLDVKFKNGVIQMPDIILDDSMCSLLLSCVAFEQSCNAPKYFSIYATFLHCLVNTARDVDYLCSRGVIGNFLGTDEDAALFINNLSKDLNIYNNSDDDYLFLFDVFEDVNKYYRKGLKWGKWTSFKSEYFGKPWLLISAFVGFALLVLTFGQTYYTIYGYLHPKK